MGKKEEFKILSPREHVRTRIGMYMGSASLEVTERFVLGKWRAVTYVPALSKMVDEIIDNAVDEGIRTKFAKANKIEVTVKNGAVTVTDNGRGIPQDLITAPETGEKIPRPVAAWTRVNAGTNFNDERTTGGANGVGSSCTNFLSTSFIGTTWTDGKGLEVACSDGGLNLKVTKRRMIGSGTTVSFAPDFSLLGVNSLEEHDTIALIKDRLTNLQMAFPEIAFTFNGERVEGNDLKKYAALYAGENGTVVSSKSENLSYFFVSSADGFLSNSYVNNINTRLGGSYVEYITNEVVDQLVGMIKRKHKVEVSKSVIKNGLTLIVFARNFTNPRFDSQTKERLTSPAGTIKEHYEKSGANDLTYMARKLLEATDIIEPIIAAQVAKKLAQDKRDAAAAQKALKKVKVAKHIAATSDKARLCLVEGDSAMGFLLKVRDKEMVGAYPLRGKSLNTWDKSAAEALKNKEIAEVVGILGLDIADPDSVDRMTYKDIATLTDADHDGSHIMSLLIGFFFKYWPRLFSEGRFHITRSPIMISTNGKDTKWFYSYQEASAFKQNSKGYSHRYIKGLASLTEEEYDKIINDPVLDTVVIDDETLLEMMLGEKSVLRKEFMTT